MSEQVLSVPGPAQLRDQLQRLVLQDLLGPAGGPDEEVTDRTVRERYLVGQLAPSGKSIEPEEFDDLAVEGGRTTEDGQADLPALQMPSMSPSSFGLSFQVEGNCDRLRLGASWGHYERTDSETTTNAAGEPKQTWHRTPRGGQTVIALVEGRLKKWLPEPQAQPQVYVEGLVRRSAGPGGGWTITLFLINGQTEPKRNRDEQWLFQAELTVEGPDGQPVFVRRRAAAQATEAEARAMEMRYRRSVNFAMGHGVSVHAEQPPGDPTRAVRLTTRAVPDYELPRTEAPTPQEIPGLAGLVLDMKELAELPQADLAEGLLPLVTAYAEWIEDGRERVRTGADGLADYEKTAKESLAECRTALSRIRAGIELVTTDPQAARAFAFTNAAMWQQRIHSLNAEQVRRGHPANLEGLDVPANRSWRPFQLAFVLLNLPSLTDLNHPERQASDQALADLLWFPTGGGKTEAYLGLTAYTLAIRRLQGVVEGRSGGEGVAVIMRYTLRLLTLQQFQRAAALICACETLRRAEPLVWGATPFRLGLWVGQRTTPNSTEQSAEAIKHTHGTTPYNSQGSSLGGTGSPAQLTNCPWCGTPIVAGRDIKVDSFAKGRGRTLIYCGDSLGQCAFTERNSPGEGLPVVVVDEEIYRLLPALLIATVDKFAQLPWNGATQMLFGQVNGWCSRHGFRSPTIQDTDTHPAVAGKLPAARSVDHAPLRPPDLIIQDELHLISGPLGTLVGLYEAAIDRLASWEVKGQRVRPKVIASTATIRRAPQQIHALFLRQVKVFPPQALDAEDNFFARQRPTGPDTPGRRYIGICASGRRLKAALIRVYVAYLAAGQYLYNQYGAAIDPWLTLIGYFNSMNELGGMRRLVEDDVRARVGKMSQHGMANRQPPLLEELTSRRSSTDIPNLLDRLETTFDPARDARRKAGEASKSLRPLDVLLATNMISVGVDVKRLGLMVVAGQPKTTAEYIQATSRVGRSWPGLVCVVYNWARPRDLSHYEQFEHYHETFYQYVEALSVTPFALRALDRGLGALLVSYVRLAGTEFNDNARAGSLVAGHPYLKAALDELSDRAVQVTGRAEVGVGVRDQLEYLRDNWLRKAGDAQGGKRLGYRGTNDGLTVPLLEVAGRGERQPFSCLNSLRDVEASINLILDDGDLDFEERGPGNGEQESLDVAGVVHETPL